MIAIIEKQRRIDYKSQELFLINSSFLSIANTMKKMQSVDVYRRQDAIGTPYCITIDFDTLEDDTVTIRERDTLEQKRISINDIEKIVSEGVDMKTLFLKKEDQLV